MYPNYTFGKSFSYGFYQIIIFFQFPLFNNIQGNMAQCLVGFRKGGGNEFQLQIER